MFSLQWSMRNMSNLGLKCSSKLLLLYFRHLCKQESTTLVTLPAASDIRKIIVRKM